MLLVNTASRVQGRIITRSFLALIRAIALRSRKLGLGELLISGALSLLLFVTLRVM